MSPKKVSASPHPLEGKEAPDFTLANGNGETVALSALRGKPVVLYFYPKDDTPGCTLEAKEFRDAAATFEAAGAVVLGVSPDSVASHCKFTRKYDLNFQLLSDNDHTVAEKYGVWVEKTRCGRTYWGIQRATFLINSKGIITTAWPQVKPEGHAAEVLAALTTENA